MSSGYPGITAPPIISNGRVTPTRQLPLLNQSPNTSGMSNDPVHDAGANRTPSSAMTPTQVRSMQQFLVNHGFNVAQDGILGPQTKGAAKAFRANHLGGAAWNKANGIGVHPGTQPHDTAGAVPPAAGHSGGGTPAGTNPHTAFNNLLAQLLGQGGNVGSPFDPTALGNAAAAPDDALAATLTRQAAQNPRDEAQHQHDISSWYGLDPNDPNYKLSVLGRLAQARGLDAKSATDTSSNVSSIAQQLASSIGGSANDGSGEVAAAGANAAGTASALGEADKQYSDQMGPLLAAEARGASSKDKATMQQALLDLQDKQAAAAGQAKADRANAAAGAVDKNNSLAQQRFANKGNLLSTLAQMSSVDPNANYLKDALTAAKIKYADARTNQVLTGKSSTGQSYRVDIGKAAKAITTNLGYQGDKQGRAIVPPGDETRLAHQIGAYLRAQNIVPGDGQFKKIGDALYSTFVDPTGRPLTPPKKWAI